MDLNYATLIPHVVALLAHLAGLVVAIWLLVQIKSKAAILAAVSFGLLTLVSLGLIVLSLPPVAKQFAVNQWLPWTLGCCCSIFDAAAIVCLIVAIWKAVSGARAGETDESLYDETWEEEANEVTDSPVEPPDTYATEKLETPAKDRYATEVLEGEVIEETAQAAPEAPRVTRVLSEEQTPEDTPYATKVMRDTEEESEES